MAPADLSLWRWDPVGGDGPVWDVRIHMVDLLCWLHNGAPVEVFATGGQVIDPHWAATANSAARQVVGLQTGHRRVAAVGSGKPRWLGTSEAGAAR